MDDGPGLRISTDGADLITVHAPTVQPPGGWLPDPQAAPSATPARRRPAWPWVAVALVAVLVMASVGTALFGGLSVLRGRAGLLGVGGRPSAGVAPGSRDQIRAAGISATLALMTQALRRRDEATFLTAVDPRSAGLVARERAALRGMLALPLQDPQFSWSGTPREVPVASGEPAGSVAVAVDFRYRLATWDEQGADDPVAYTFAPVAGRWLIVGDTEDMTGLAQGRYAEPWTVGAVPITQARPHVLVVGDPAHRGALQHLADRLETVVGDVRRLWPEPGWNGKIVAYAMTDRRFVAEWFGAQAADGSHGPGGEATFEARVANLPSAGSGHGVLGGPTRMIVTPYLLAQTDGYSLSVLRHEATHVATARAGRYPPIWLLEGAAEYTGFRLGGAKVNAVESFGRHGVPAATARAMARGAWQPKLVNDSAGFYNGSSRVVQNAYVDGWVAALYVADHYGDSTLRRLYDVAAAQDPAASWDQVNASALANVLHTTPAAFTAAVRRYGIGLRRHFE